MPLPCFWSDFFPSAVGGTMCRSLKIMAVTLCLPEPTVQPNMYFFAKVLAAGERRPLRAGAVG
jgi:hypothetical protein